MKKINVLLLTLIFVLSSIVSIFTQTIEDKMLKKREQRILN